MTITKWLPEKIGQDIWDKKYKFDNETLDEWFIRVSGGNKEVEQLIKDKKFLFGGRILASRGLNKVGKRITYSNCFVLDPPEDNIESIFECAKKMARTYSAGGGVGVDISKLRPRKAITNNAAKESTGAVSFSSLYDLTTSLISQSGRRGALMLSISCTHPDLEEFIDLKTKEGSITKANISIRITDAFMEAVKFDKDWDMEFIVEATGERISKTVKAKYLFEKLVKNNSDWAEPGILFWDSIENWNLLSEDSEFSYSGVNPCAEEPLPSGGSCLLGSINLSEFVINPFTDSSEFDHDEFAKCVSIATVALNEVLDEGLSLLPLEEQRQSVSDYRQIGLGIFGLADMLIKLGLKYGELESLKLCDEIGFTMIDSAIGTSALLAKEHGKYPKYNESAILNSKFFQFNTSETTKTMVKEFGLRNSQLLTTAPTGTLSTMIGVSGGIEPIFSYGYSRKTESLHGEDVFYKIYTPIVKQYMDKKKIKTEEELPLFFTNAMLMNWKNRIDMQAIWQRHIDASISSTVNLPNSATHADIHNVYMYAWEQKLKGVTIYRDGCLRSGILLTESSNKEDVPEKLERGYIEDVPTDLQYRKYKLATGCGFLYLFIGVDKDTGKIYDCFTNTDGTGGCVVNTQANSRLLSTAIRGGISIEHLIKQLEKSGVCPSFQYKRGKGEELCKGKSCASAIAHVLRDIVKEMPNKDAKKTVGKIVCPECKSENYVMQEGCTSCMDCGYSKCSV